MSKLKIFLILTGYQLTWLACIFGDKNFSEPLIGIIIGTIFILIYCYYSEDKKKFIQIILLISIPGYLFDILMVYGSVYNFTSIDTIFFLPPWMIVLWLSFATLFYEVLVFFKNYKIIGVTISGFAGPITYYLGEPLGIIVISNYNIFFIIMFLFWSTLMYLYLNFILRFIQYLE